jgi:SHOCT-like protein
MNDDRRSILEMLATGRITADEADRLLGALDRGPTPESSSSGSSYPSNAPKSKYLRVVVDTDEPGDGGPTKVNIRVPMQLLRAGVRLSSLIPPKARDEVNAAMQKEGIPFDINQLKPENLEELVEHLSDLTVDVDQEKTKVRIFCE